MRTGAAPDAIWAKGRAAVRTAYRRSLEYSLSSLVSWVETYGDENTVLVVLGDHQAAPLLTAPGAGRDVPVTIVAGDPAVLDRVAVVGLDAGDAARAAGAGLADGRLPRPVPDRLQRRNVNSGWPGRSATGGPS